MIIAAHTIVGGVVGEWIGNPVVAFLVGIILHFVLDSIPHFDTVDKQILSWRQLLFTGADFLLTLFLIFWIIKLPLDRTILNSSFAWGAVGGIFPDLLDNVPFWKAKFRSYKFGYKFNQFHYRIQPDQPGVFLGMLTQIIAIAIALAIHFAIVR